MKRGNIIVGKKYFREGCRGIPAIGEGGTSRGLLAIIQNMFPYRLFGFSGGAPDKSAGEALDSPLAGKGAHRCKEKRVVVFGGSASALGAGCQRRIPERVPQLSHPAVILNRRLVPG